MKNKLLRGIHHEISDNLKRQAPLSWIAFIIAVIALIKSIIS